MIVRPIEPKGGTRVPRVAVIVPCYNYGRFLPDCVRSIVSQPDVTTSVHIIDDASTDGSFAIAEWLASQHLQVKATRHRVNQGHIATYNEGLRAVDSDYVVLLSADDQLAPGSLSRAMALMEAHPRVGLVYGNPQTFTENPTPRSNRVRSWSVWTGQRWISAQFKRGLSIIYSPEAVVRTSVHREAGYYRSSLPHSGDLELWLRIAEIAAVGRVNGPDQAYRRVHASSMMQSSYGSVPKDLRERFRAYYSFLENTKLPEQRRLNLELMARRRASEEAFGWAAAERETNPESIEIREAVEYGKQVFDKHESLNAYRLYTRRSATVSNSTFDRLGDLWLSASVELPNRMRWRSWHRYGI